MKKTLMALGAVAALTVSAVAIPAPAHAQRGVAAGVAAGLLGGAIVGGAIASQNGYYYGPGYYAPGYGGPAYVVEPGYGESASGSGSASGTAMAGGSATSGFATSRSPSLNCAQHPGKAPVFRDGCRFRPEKTVFFGHALANVYFRLTDVRFFSETAVRKRRVSHP